MKYDFYDILGIDNDANIEEITTALYNKLEELKDNRDIKLWNYLLRTASELQIQIDRSRMNSKQEVSEEFWKILGISSNTPVDELEALLSAKYKEPEVLTNTRVWNILHRGAQKLGINPGCEESVTKGTK